MSDTKSRKGTSLSEVNASVDTGNKTGFFRKLFAFLGPAYMVSVGYMDPGNWATDLAGGSGFGYSLIWVLLMSNLMALLLQSMSARLGLVRGLDLAQASRESYPGWINFFLYLLAEIAIAAMDLAEVLGMAIGIKLLTGIGLFQAVLITVLDTFLLLFLLQFGIRKMEAFIISLVGVVGACFLLEMIFVKPNLGEVAGGFVPFIPEEDALYIAIGIIGATVMPHNLYLHSSLVQSRRFEHTPSEIKKAIRFNFIDSAVALNLAFFVNAAILILAATAFHKNGMFEIASIEDAHRLLAPMVGNVYAPILFAVALIAAGQSSTITGTLAGQIVMEGYLQLRIQPWVRRMITRTLAIAPSLIFIYSYGESSTGKLLILSQVILSMQLGFAVIPLIHAVSSRKLMGEFRLKSGWIAMAWLCAAIIVGLNVKLVAEEISSAYEAFPQYATLFNLIILPLVFIAVWVLLYITFGPLFMKKSHSDEKSLHGEIRPLNLGTEPMFKLIAVAVDFSSADNDAIEHALSVGKQNAKLILIHSVETAGAIMLGREIKDKETQKDQEALQAYVEQIRAKEIDCSYRLCYGRASIAIPNAVIESGADLLVMAAHGHRGIKDIFFGTTIDKVRHSLKIAVHIVDKH